MESWKKQLRYDPIPLLLESSNPAILFHARRELLNQNPGSVQGLWALPEPARAFRIQLSDGSWRYHAPKTARSQENYNQLETYRNLAILVEKYGCTRLCPAIERVAEFLFDFQTPAGDLRGIYGNQYTPNYTAAIMELLIKAGYKNDRRIEKGFRWLLSARQDDGGWAIPIRTKGLKLDALALQRETIERDATRPHAHLVTGVVLRAFAAHSFYRLSFAARQAASLLAHSLMKRDSYPDRGTDDYWYRFSYPFWFTDLISALDTLSQLGLKKDDNDVMRSLNWFMTQQKKDGGWQLKVVRGGDKSVPFWLDLAICRVFKRLVS